MKKKICITIDDQILDRLNKTNKYGLSLSKSIEIVISNYLRIVEKRKKKSQPEQPEQQEQLEEINVDELLKGLEDL